ncbi:MAG: RagB/SusD family nutrient uptake outer membrane protein [Prolixibacteraceae bacterium]|jgi:hypothetical protein
MKKINIKRKFGSFKIILSLLLLSGSSCTSYLDVSPDAGVSETDAFKDFVSFQGYVEGAYVMVTNPWYIGEIAQPNLADDGWSHGWGQFFDGWDAGDYTVWATRAESYFGRTKLNTNPRVQSGKGEWPASWHGINVVNYGLANLDKLAATTQQEKDVLKGQMLFLRGYFYFTLMRHWGGMPYLTEPLDVTGGIPQLPRLNYQETAALAAKDMADAAALLPMDWDNEPVGQLTIGNNRLRINKIIALSFHAKCLLYAASPLMNYESKGSKAYDPELCKQAAQVFKQVIDLCNSTGRYSLQPWASINDVFFKTNKELPGGKEMIWAGPVLQNRVVRAYFEFLFRPAGNPYGCSDGFFSLSYQYSKNFGMKNGLPITDPASEYNPSDPWSNRDPRFDAWVLIDGNPVTKAVQANRLDEFAQLYNGGAHRTGTMVESGIATSKFWDITCNYRDNTGIDKNFVYNPPFMRLTDVYLMYAEAVLWGYGTPKSVLPNDASPLTPEAAVNLVRARANVPAVDAKFTGSRDTFFEQLIVERAVELSFEGFRWDDLRRWLRNDDPRYIDKTMIKFNRGSDGKPINLEEVVYRKRIVGEKHNWLPLPTSSVTIYPEFRQNPGW